MISTHLAKYRMLALLVCGIAASLWLHASLEMSDSKQELFSLGQIDRAVEDVIAKQGLDGRWERTEIPVDSLFSRATYEIWVPEDFSRTTFHIGLQERLAPLGTVIFGEVTFPSRDLRLYITYRQDLLRTVMLSASPDESDESDESDGADGADGAE